MAQAFKAVLFVALVVLLWPARYGGFLQVTMVNGTSMNPTFYTGDLVLSVKTKNYSKGDIIVYHPKDLQCSRCNVIHRIVSGDKEAWTTKGDNNANTDPWHPGQSEVLGKVVFYLKARGWSHFILAPQLWVTFLLFAGGLGLLWYLWENHLKEPEEEEPVKPKRDRRNLRT